jgi:hypothetical protein
VPAHSIRKTKGWALPSIAGTGAAQLDQGIVDAADGEGGHQVLDGADARAVAAAERGRAGGADDQIVAGRERGGAGAVGPVEADAGRGVGRVEGQGDAGAGMEADAHAADGMGDGPLRPDGPGLDRSCHQRLPTSFGPPPDLLRRNAGGSEMEPKLPTIA